MTREEFSDLMGRVFLYFGANRPSTAQLDAWHKEVSRIPSQAIKILEERLKQRESLTIKTNVPQFMNQEFSRIAATSAIPDAVFYDRVEDLRFPVAIMYRAYDILDRNGEVEFAKYCEAVRMPLNDRERVRNKLRVVRAAEVERGAIQKTVETESAELPF